MAAFLFYSQFGETIDLASYLLHVEDHEVLIHITDTHHQRIGEGIVPHVSDWYRYIGEGYIWVFDTCLYGDLQDWLRESGESVVGGCAAGDGLENDRQKSQNWFRYLGFDQVWSQNFTSIDDVISYVEDHSDQVYILKQNSDAPKSINHKGKFADSEDMVFHLQDLKKSWNEQEYGKFDCDLMEVVEGLEVAASAFFNGHDWLRDESGKVVGYLNFEEKKEADGGTGETTGEMGTTFIGVDESDELFSSIVLRDDIVEYLTSIGFRGVFDINCIQSEGRLVALEPTMRFGVPASSYEFIEGLASPCGELLESMAQGVDRPISIHQGPGMVTCVVAKPFPVESDVDENSTSLGEKLWLVSDNEPIAELTPEQRQHIHLWNFEKSEDEESGDIAYKVPTKSGYLLTVTSRGDSVRQARKRALKYIESNLYIPGMKYRTDIGERVEEYERVHSHS